ncbi:MAG: MFS transporter [Pseudomonadota bacterium]
MTRAWRATGFAAALYLLVGANLPYLPVFLEQARGFSGSQISASVAAATMIRIFTGPVFAAAAERTGLSLILGRLSLVLLLSFVAVYPASAIAPVFCLVVVVFVAWGALAPLTEALLVASTKSARPDYGTARAIASSSFILSSFVVGAALRTYGPDAILWALIGAACLLTFSSTLLVGERPNAAQGLTLRETVRQGFDLFGRRRILLYGLGVSLIQATHAYYYNLGSNIWIAEGIPTSHLGPLWSTGVAAEVLLLLGSGLLFARWTPGAIILLGGVGAVARWTLTGLSPPLGVLYVLQALHALTFAATHIGGLKFLSEEVPPEKLPVAMSIASAVAYGPMLALFGILTGFYYDWAATTEGMSQAFGYWFMAGVACLGCGCALGIVRRQPQRSALGGET